MRPFSTFPFLGVLFLLTALSGCVATQSDYGNFVDKNLIANQTELAKDSVKQLEKLYPPAKNQLVLQQETPDVLGKALVLGLREAGFALQSFDKDGRKSIQSPHSSNTVLPLNPNEPLQWDFAYLFDQAGEPDLYRLTLFLGHQSLSRLYRLDDNRFIPAGNLVWKKE